MQCHSNSSSSKNSNSNNNSNKYTEHSEPILEAGTLSCAGRDLTSISISLANKFALNTKNLDFSFNLLSDLTNLEKFTQLESLILDNNLIDDSVQIPEIKTLKTFSINNNKISDLELFLSKLKVGCVGLKLLSMLKNPACPNHLVGGDDDEYKRYRYQVIFHIPDLKFLDSTQVTAPERTEATRIGPFLKVAKPAQKEPTKDEKDKEKDKEKDENDAEFPPLPQDLARHGEHRGTFGVSKYVYYGKHSEGNRFIRNSDL